MFRRRVKKQAPTFPDTIEGFGYVVKENGEIRSKDTDQPYEFEHIPKDRPYNELRYDHFIRLVGDLVEEKLQQEPLNFKKHIVPVEADPSKGDIHSYIYMTPNFLTTTDKVLVLITGNNHRIGQWSRRVMCDENINTGSMINVALMGKERGYETIILNPNGNYWFDNQSWERTPKTHMKFQVIPGNETPEAHCSYVYKHFLNKIKAEKVAVIAVNWGGGLFVDILLKDHFDFVKDKVKAVALTDSSHSRDTISGDDKRVWMRNHMINYVASTSPKGELLADERLGCECFSSGQEISDFTLSTCINEMIRFIDIKMGDYVPEDVDDEIRREEELEAENAELDDHMETVINMG